MATSQSTMDFLLDQLSGLTGLSTRKMFGEYCVYLFGKPIGFVCDDQLHLKMTDAGRAWIGNVQESIPYPDAKPHLLVTADLWEDRDWLRQVVQITADALRSEQVMAELTRLSQELKMGYE